MQSIIRIFLLVVGINMKNTNRMGRSLKFSSNVSLLPMFYIVISYIVLGKRFF